MCTPPSPPKKCLFAAITFLLLGSLGNDGGDVNKNGKKAIGFKLAKQQQLFSCITLFLNFFAVTV